MNDSEIGSWLDALAAILKTLLYVGIMTSTGAVFAAATLQGGSILEDAAIRAMRWGALCVIPISLLGAIVLIFRLGGQFDEATLGAVFSSNTGAAFFMQLTSAALLLALGNDESARGIRLVSAAVATLSIAFSGHAAAMGPFEAMFVFVHASAAAWWIGSLLLLRIACEKLEIATLDILVRRFSMLATQLVGALVIAGMLLIYALVGFESLPSLSAYERNLGIKLAIVALVLGIAGYNKYRLTPRLVRGDATAARSLKTMINIELAVIGAILVATAILTTYSSPHDSVS
jgi:putative copper export protein